MRKRWFLVGMIFLLVPWLFVGCGIAQEQYDSVVAERDSLVANLQSFQSEFEVAKSELNLVQSELESIKSEYQSIKAELDTKISEIESLKNEMGTKESALSSTKSQLDSTKAELEAFTSELEATKSELESVRAQLSEQELVTPPSLPTVESLTYNNTEYGFSLKYPKGWNFDEGIMGTTAIFMGPFDIEEEFSPNIGIALEKLPVYPKLTLEDYLALGRLQMEGMFENVITTDEYKTTINQLPAIVYTYLYDLEGTTLKATQMVFLKENFAWVIQYTSTPRIYDKYRISFDLVVGSFKFE